MALPLGPLISAGASLLGGLFGKKQKAEYVVPEYGQIRSKAEAAGFNPLTALTSAPGSAVASQNYMGSAIADAGLILADGLAKNVEEKGENEQLRRQNAELAKKVQDLTIRPRVGGIYAGNVSTPSLREALGGSDDASSGSVRSGLHSGGGAAVPSGVGGVPAFDRPLEEKDDFDPRREVDNAPINSTSGIMKVDNPWLPFPLYAPTMDGDEALNWYDYPSLIVPSLAGFGHWAGRKVGSYVDDVRASGTYGFTSDGKRYALQRSPKRDRKTLPYLNYPPNHPMTWGR